MCPAMAESSEISWRKNFCMEANTAGPVVQLILTICVCQEHREVKAFGEECGQQE